MRLNAWVKRCGCVLVSVLLLACGGGGGDAGSSSFTPTTSGGTGTTAVPTAADLLVSLSSTSLTNSGTNTIGVTVTAVNASRVAVANVPVTISVDNSAVAVVSGSATGADGKLTATVQTGTDRSNRIVTVTATAGSVQKSASFSVVGAKLDASVLQAVIAPGTTGQIQYRLTDVNSNPMVGLPISVSGAGITPASGTTDINGAYTLTYVSPSTAGNLDITATAGGLTVVKTVSVQSGAGSVPAVASAIMSASVSADSVVSVNSASSANRAEIRALFLGAGNAPLANVRVRFDLNGDPLTIGGSLTSGSNIVYSDANGVATTAYIPGTRSSPTNGVTVRACYFADDVSAAVPGACPNSAVKSLTVISETVAVSIGTDNTITDGAGGLTYIKKFVVLVVDSAGQAKANVQITPSIDLTGYLKGFYGKPGDWSRDAIDGGYVSAVCANEDVNRNAVLESGEDINNNGQLDPRKSDVAISMIGTGLTDGSGVATLQIQYPKNVATWVFYRILISASGVSGTEGRTSWSGLLGAAASEFTSETSPSFMVSPYGKGNPLRSPVAECQAAD